jgi:hypothetical protein
LYEILTKVDIKNAEWLCPADVNEGSKAPTDGSADDDNKMKNRMQESVVSTPAGLLPERS